jgi:hypothetical protein
MFVSDVPQIEYNAPEPGTVSRAHVVLLVQRTMDESPAMNTFEPIPHTPLWASIAMMGRERSLTDDQAVPFHRTIVPFPTAHAFDGPSLHTLWRNRTEAIAGGLSIVHV